MHGTANKRLLKTIGQHRLDMRRPRSRRFAQLVATYTDDLAPEPSNAQRVLIRDLATLTLLCEDLQTRLIDDPQPEDVRDYERLSTSVRSSLRKLGLTGVRQDDEFEAHDPDLDRPVRERL
jgi:hypothetical protein